MNRTPLETEIQYRTTMYWIGRFDTEIAMMENESISRLDPRIRQAALDGMKAIVADLVWERDEWERRHPPI